MAGSGTSLLYCELWIDSQTQQGNQWSINTSEELRPPHTCQGGFSSDCGVQLSLIHHTIDLPQHSNLPQSPTCQDLPFHCLRAQLSAFWPSPFSTALLIPMRFRLLCPTWSWLQRKLARDLQQAESHTRCCVSTMPDAEVTMRVHVFNDLFVSPSLASSSFSNLSHLSSSGKSVRNSLTGRRVGTRCPQPVGN